MNHFETHSFRGEEDKTYLRKEEIHTAVANPESRLDWIDNAKGLGILLVVAGHVLVLLYCYGSSYVTAVGKWIYAFHMPLFFFLSGFFWKSKDVTFSAIASLAGRRLVPVVFFGMLGLLLLLLKLFLGLLVVGDLKRRILGYFLGQTLLDTTTWFLVCLFMCEIIAMVVLPRCRNMPAKFLAGLSIMTAGLVYCDFVGKVSGWSHIPVNTWYVSESLIAFGFYAAGNALHPLIGRITRATIPLRLLITAAGFAVLTATFQLNPLLNVVMYSSEHGDAGLFLLSAAGGIAGLLGLAISIPGSRMLTIIGRYSLGVMALSGLFDNYANDLLIRWLQPPNTLFGTVIFTGGVTAGVVVFCVPLAALMERWTPFLIGRHRSITPVSRVI